MQTHILANADTLSIAVADWMVDYIDEVLKQKDKFTLVLSGGSTPKKLHLTLASDNYKNKIDWSKIHCFWGDERFVPFTDERSNARMAFDTLLNHVPVVKENIHIMRTEDVTPQESANEYESILHNYFPADAANTFDLVLLGMGDNAHTLSLFPGMPEIIHETKKRCVHLWLEEQSMFRITLTHAIVNKARAIAFLVTGSNKAEALHEVLKGEYNPDQYPSQIIKPEGGQLHWFLDEAAAAGLQ